MRCPSPISCCVLFVKPARSRALILTTISQEFLEHCYEKSKTGPCSLVPVTEPAQLSHSGFQMTTNMSQCYVDFDFDMTWNGSWMMLKIFCREPLSCTTLCNL